MGIQNFFFKKKKKNKSEASKTIQVDSATGFIGVKGRRQKPSIRHLYGNSPGGYLNVSFVEAKLNAE